MVRFTYNDSIPTDPDRSAGAANIMAIILYCMYMYTANNASSLYIKIPCGRNSALSGTVIRRLGALFCDDSMTPNRPYSQQNSAYNQRSRYCTIMP
mmetsp:Transcript_33122/g.47915  ORF Transcript_33122/g.47915 Transcript_33122/m.47915 type:complete len:96 (-) Transcript_33122:440-727(-)